MNTKLTLSIQQDVIIRAKEYAKSRGRSLSDLIENYLRGLTSDQMKSNAEYTPVSEALQGSFQEPQLGYGSEMDYKKELQARREKKFLGKNG